jgi:CHASE2 domain-containing sensor protein
MTTTTTTSSDPVAALAKAQQAADAAKNAVQATEPGLHGWSPELVKFLASSVLVFTFFALLLCAVLLWRSRATGYHVLRIFGVITIVGISALLLVVGYSNEQLTPIVGLFGAIAGYLLGKDTTMAQTIKSGEPEAARPSSDA